MTKLDRALLTISYLLLVGVLAWTTWYFTDRIRDSQNQRCAADLIAADLQLELADYTLATLNAPPPDESEAAARDHAAQLRAELARTCATVS